LTNRLFLIGVMVAVSCFEGAAYFPDSTFPGFADSLFETNSDSQLTAIRIKKEKRTYFLKKEKRTYFMVTSCKTVSHPFEEVVDVVRRTGEYPSCFTFISKADVVENSKSRDSVTMFVGVYGLYRVYFFGKVSDQYSEDSAWYRVRCGESNQRPYRKAWKRRVRGLIKIGSHDVDIYWTVRKLDDSSCRVSLTASQSFRAKIPNWMVSIGTNKIFRGMIKDLDTYLDKGKAEAVAAQAE